MLYKKIEKLLNMKEEFKDRAEFIEIINKKAKWKKFSLCL